MRRVLILVTVLLGACAASRPAPVVDRGTVVNPAPAAARTASQEAAPAARPAARVPSAGAAAPAAPGLSSVPASPVQVNPVVSAGAIESRPIETRPAPPRGAAAPPAGSAAPTAPAPVAAATPGVLAERAGRAGSDASTGIRTEPRGYKLPWSEDNLALMQGQRRPSEAAGTEAKAPESKVADAKPGDPRSADAKSADARPGAGEARSDSRPEVRFADPATERPDFIWPLKGRILERFEGGSRGIGIAGNEGDPVLAAAGGTVLYAGSGIRGYGQLLIVKHNDNFISVYAHNSRLLVKQGDVVRSAQRIAEVGRTDATRPKLHFEIRRQGTSIDPLQVLPARE